MDHATAALSQLTEVLTERVSYLERKNEALLKIASEQIDALRKKASVAPVQTAAPVVSDAVANTTVNALVKLGALTSDQAKDAAALMQKDPEAVHRALWGLLDAHALEKSASRQVNLSGGTLISNDYVTAKQEDDDIARLVAILNCKH